MLGRLALLVGQRGLAPEKIEGLEFNLRPVAASYKLIDILIYIFCTISGNVPTMTNFQLQRLKETVILKWVELGARRP